MYYSTLHNINLFPKDQHRNHTMGETPGTVNTIGYRQRLFQLYIQSLSLLQAYTIQFDAIHRKPWHWQTLCIIFSL